MIYELSLPKGNAGWTGHIGIPGGPSPPGEENIPRPSYHMVTDSRLTVYPEVIQEVIKC